MTLDIALCMHTATLARPYSMQNKSRGNQLLHSEIVQNHHRPDLPDDFECPLTKFISNQHVSIYPQRSSHDETDAQVRADVRQIVGSRAAFFRAKKSAEAVLMFLQPYRRQIIALAAGSMVLCLVAASVVAQEAPKPSGTVTIHQVQVAFIGSGSGGGGTLRFQGRSYPFKVGGLGIGGIGVSTLDASGTVYNLKRVEDFDGVYGQARSGWVAGSAGGKGQLWLQNPNGVYIKLRAQREGLSLNLGADGMVVHLGS